MKNKKLLSKGLLLKAILLFFALTLLNTGLLSAQTAPEIERATRESDRFGRKEEIEKKLKVVPEEPTEPKPAEVPIEVKEQKFLIKKIKLEGCKTIPPEKFSASIKKYENKEISFGDLNKLAKEIEREYLKQGVIAAVFAPSQEVKDQTLILQVIEAEMGDLEIRKHKYFNNKRLNYYWKIPSGETLRYDEMSKDIQRMNKNPDREVKANLRAGKKPGTTDVILSTKARFPIHFTSSFDREGAVSTGRSTQTYGMRHNNFLGLDDTLLTGYTFGRDFSGIYAYHNLPINFDGTSLLYGYSASKSHPSKEFRATALHSSTKNTSVSLHQDLYKKDVYLGEVALGFEANDKGIWDNTGVYNKDRLRIFSLESNFVQRGLGSTTSISFALSQGVHAFGASPDVKDNALSSRQAKSVFTKINPGIQHKRMLPLSLQANLNLRGQFSTTKLTPQEEFALGGINSVRGYPSGDYLADSGASSNLELLIPAFLIPQSWRLPYAQKPLKEDITTVTFIDYGWGQRRGALSSEKKRVDLLGAGVGVRINLFDQALARLEWGVPLGDNRPISEKGKSRVHFSVDFQDKLPEEIERIRKIQEEENIKQWAWQLVNEELSCPDSQIKQKLDNYLSLAKDYYKQGKLKESKEYYEKVYQISKSLYEQAEDYVRACLQQQKGLNESYKLAMDYYKEGQRDKAKGMWEKIIAEAKPLPLTLEY